MRVQGANSCEPHGTQANSRREASPTSSCRHFKQFAAGSFPLNNNTPIIVCVYNTLHVSKYMRVTYV